jgi:hypothetical protein
MGFLGAIAGIDHEEQIKKKRELEDKQKEDKQKGKNKKESE